MSLVIKKAVRKNQKIKINISSASGFGKTYSSIELAKGLAGGDLSKVVVIDTENESASLYSDLGDFSVCPVSAPYTPEQYISAIDLCEKSDFEVIIIDSLSHEWDGPGGCLEIADKMGGNFSVWKSITPRHNAFIQKIINSKCHIISTTRRKQDYDVVKNEKGKSQPVKVGTKEITKDGYEYELSIAFEIVNANHLAKASKDRTRLFDGKPEFVISEQTGAEIKAWVESADYESNGVLIDRLKKMIDYLNKYEIDEQSILSYLKKESAFDITINDINSLSTLVKECSKLAAAAGEPINEVLQRNFKKPEIIINNGENNESV